MNALRPLDLPQPLVVETDERGEPLAIIRRGRRLAVETVLDRWRVDDEWWRTPIARLYRALALADGRALVVYEDLAAGGWYEQRYAPIPLPPSLEGKGNVGERLG